MDENYCALYLAIIKDYSVEKSFEKLRGINVKTINKKASKWNLENKLKLKKLYEEGVPIRDLAIEFNITVSGISQQLKRLANEGFLVRNRVNRKN